MTYLANGDSGHPYLDVAIDAGIAAGVSFSTTLSGLVYDSAVNQRPLNIAISALISLVTAIGTFFFSLQAARKRARRHRTRRRSARQE